MKEMPNLFEACTPREDVLEGKLEEDQFTASLSSVVHNPDESAEVYQDPTKFFEKTYPTKGLKKLLTALASNFLYDQHDKNEHSASLCLDTTFGGGKTHDLIASYHLAQQPDQIDNLGNFVKDDEVLEAFEANAESLDVRTSVIVGTDLDAKSARSDYDNPDHPNTKTLWGEIAYQLFGQGGYEAIKEYDEEQQAPGSNNLKRLFKESDEPCLILIDEIAAYLESAASEEVGNSTLTKQTTSFFFNMLEAISELDHVTLIYSIADDAFADKAEEVRETAKQAIEELGAVGKRKHETIAPTDEEEVGSVLRYRLFDEIDEEAGEDVASEYYQFFQENQQKLPNRYSNVDFKEELQREYPIHPSIIKTLTDKVESITKFQKTRDALKFLAGAIHHLYDRKDELNQERHFIRLFDLTPAEPSIHDRMSETLFEFVDLDAAVRSDIYNSDGNSHAQVEDRKWLEKDLPPLGTQVTVPIFWNSLAVGQKATGLTRTDLRGAIGHPDVDFEHISGALENLTGKNEMENACFYLYDEERIKFKAEPNHIRIIQQEKDNIPDRRAKNRLKEKIEGNVDGGGLFDVRLFRDSPADIPDDYEEPKLCIMHFDSETVDKTNGDANVPETIESMHQKKASSSGGELRNRQYKNYVLFLLADDGLLSKAMEHAKKFEAVKNLLQDSQKTSDLSNEQVDDIKERKEKQEGLLGENIRDAYRHLFYTDESGELDSMTVSFSGDGTIQSAVLETLRQAERVIDSEDNAKAPIWVDNKLWKQAKSKMTAKELLKQFARKAGLPFLISFQIFQETIKRAVNEKQSDYVAWDETKSIAYWPGGAEPENWEHEESLAESDQVQEKIEANAIHDDEAIIIYDSMETLLDEQTVKPPEPEFKTVHCDECGQELEVSKHKQQPFYCEEHAAKGQCVECDTEVPGTTPEDEPIYCSEHEQTEKSWESTTEEVQAGRALTEVRDKAQENVDDQTEEPLLEQAKLYIQGADRLKSANFLLQKQVLRDRSDAISVIMEYSVEANGSRMDVQFDGTFDDFDQVKKDFENFSNGTEAAKDVQVIFEYAPDEPDRIGEDDLLSELEEVISDTDITLKAKANGVVRELDELT